MRERLVVDLDDPVINAERDCHGSTGGGVFGQNPDAVVLFAKIEFADGTDHAEGRHASDLGLLDFEVAREICADGCDGDLLSHCDIRRAADNREGFVLADVHCANGELLGIRVRHASRYTPDDDVVELWRESLDSLDLGGRECEVVCELLGGDVGEINVSREPAHGDVH